MKLAAIDSWIWVIIFVVVAVSKGWSKMQESAEDDTSETDEPVSRPIPRPQARPLRPPPPVVVQKPAQLPSVTPANRGPRPLSQRPGNRQMRGIPKPWRDLVSQMQQQLQPPVAALPAKARPVPAPAPVPATTPVPSPTPVAVAESKPSRGAIWREALRDKNNFRNIIISAEIIGPPKALTD